MTTHLVKTMSPKGGTAKCGATVSPVDSTIWWSDVDCPKCRPYVFRDDDKGTGRKMVPVGEQVEPTPPLVKVMKRRSKR
jgi:hypothetical protein